MLLIGARPLTGRDGDNGVGDLVSEVRLRGLLHLGEDHRRHLFRGEILELATVADFDHRLAALVDNLERPVLHVLLDVAVGVGPADETLGVKYRVVRVLGSLVFRRVANETFLVGETDPRRSDTVTLVVCDDFNLAAALNATIVSKRGYRRIVSLLLTRRKSRSFPDRYQ